METQKLISICIPTYNREKDLEAALHTILPQIGPDVEVIISDNSSTDGTRAMVERYQHDYPGLRCHMNSANVGFDRNMCKCLQLAEGEYIWYFGSDDELKPGSVEAVRQALHDKPAMLFLNHEVFAEPDEILLKSMLGRGKDLHFRSPNAYIAFIGMNFSFVTALVLKRNLCLQVDDIEAVLGTGWIHLHTVLWILAHEHSFRFIGYPYVRARARPEGDYDILPVFVHANTIIWHSHKYGHPYWILYLLISRTLVDKIMQLVGRERARGSRSIRELVGLLVRAYWMFPHFWVLVFPLVFLPRGLMVVMRNAYRYWRALVWGARSPT